MRFTNLQQGLETLRGFADHALDPIFMVDQALKMHYYNRAFEQVLGIRMRQPFYRTLTCQEILGLEICESNCIMRRSLEVMQPLRLAEIVGNIVTGETRRFYISAVPIEMGEGVPFGALIFLRDVTQEAEIHDKYKLLASKNSAITLSGKLEEGDLVNVIQLITFLKRTGELGIECENERGALLFSNGQLSGIQVGGALREKALGRMLSWTRGTFSFSPGPVVETEPLDIPAEFMLMDAVREKDEIANLGDRIPPPETKPTVDQDVLSGVEKELSDLDFGIIFVLHQGANVGELLSMLQETDASILLALVTLKEKGVLRW